MEQNQTIFNQPAATEQPPMNPPVSQSVKMSGPIALFKESLNVYKEHFSSLISISLLFLIGTFFSFVIPGFGYSFFGLVFVIGAYLLVSFLIPLALMVALRSLMAGESVKVADYLKSAVGIIIPAIGINILSGLVVVGASIPLLIPGMIVGILLYFSLFSLVIEGQRGFNALMRSRHLVKGNVSAVFLRMFVLGLIISIPVVLFSLISGIFQLPEATEQIVNGFLTVLLFPLSIVYSYLLFRFLARQRPLESFNPQEKRGFYKGLMVWGIVAIIILIVGSFLLFGNLLGNLLSRTPVSFSEEGFSLGDVGIITSLSQIRIQAEIYFNNNHSSYIGVDDWDRNPEMKVLVEELIANGGQAKWGMITPQSYVVWSPLVSEPESFYCVDSTVDACKLNREPEGGERVATKCGCLTSEKQGESDFGESDFSEPLKRSRDSARLADINIIKSAIGLYLAALAEPEKEWAKICHPGKIYTSNEGTTAVDGTGWLPINFNKMTSGSPIEELPLDPINTPLYHYRFSCDAENLTFELNLNFESDYYKSQAADDGGDNNAVYEVGTDLKIIH